jgi:ABC-type siderophore export system fused ATPase/permease subunit
MLAALAYPSGAHRLYKMRGKWTVQVHYDRSYTLSLHVILFISKINYYLYFPSYILFIIIPSFLYSVTNLCGFHRHHRHVTLTFNSLAGLHYQELNVHNHCINIVHTNKQTKKKRERERRKHNQFDETLKKFITN